ncbi:FemAB family XrtA/PEP-CTERM system-associated protein [Sphingomonas jatrophae]|uniref:FemAB-related protein, PEP-CTERM system-associated n=1 Tax=Sphingomonas jatrophae TaxID=1166337 RepID=A0A1I6JWP1_9SPHN|nr:FemAB family XrtA/PEP-CTERM system-associated protein [Sphingomonas jatrophae]SFR83392.1 FemAB-related protein, PEP-CTERM system-associated [Sphingomonas jatrophae]
MKEGPLLRTRIRLGELHDDARLDAYAREHPQGTPFHLAAWGRGVAAGCGQRHVALVAERGGALTGFVPLTEVHSPLFGRALVSSGFAVGGGIIADDDATAELLAEAAWDQAERRVCPTLELRGGHLPEGWARDETSYVGFTRPIAADDEAELKAIPRKQRAEVRRALGFDLEVEIGRDVATHHAVYATSVRNLGTPVFPRRMFAEVLERFGEEADILTVRHDGRAIASVLSLYWRGCVMPYWGGGTAEARTWRANDLMYFALMRHARERGCTSFDFGRSKVGTGAAAFKRNWGFEAVPLAYASRTAAGEAKREINPLSPKYRMQVALWQKLPLRVANLLGPGISRGLG